MNAGIGRLFQTLDWSDFQGDNSLKELCQLYLENAEVFVGRGTGIILTGEYGVGKTLSLMLLMKDLVKMGYSVYATTFSSMIELLTAGWKSQEEQLYYVMKVKKSEVLLIDNIGFIFCVCF